MIDGKDELDTWNEISEEIQKKLPLRITEIETKFRKILNVEEE